MDKVNLNKLRTQQEEQRAINSVYDKIVREFIDLQHIGEDSAKPDFRLNYNGRKICIEMTRIEPYQNRDLEPQCRINDCVEKLIRKVIKDNGINPICTIHIVLGPSLSLLKKGTKIKNIKGIEKIICAALKGRINRNYFIEFTVNRKIGAKRLMQDEEYKSVLRLIERVSGKPLPEIVFTNPSTMLQSINEQDIDNAIKHKESRYVEYKNNSEESFEEIWLCLYIPKSEYGFTIKGASIPMIETKFERIYLSEEQSLFARLIYSKDKNLKLDI